jgi:hypothetical protein
MSLIGFLKRFLIFQNLAASLIAKISPIIEHNVGKYIALKKAFYLTALENLQGDYLEFGVFTGGSLVFATKADRSMAWMKGKDSRNETRFFGFDSFQGFGENTPSEQHPFYKDDIFAVNYEKVRRNIEKRTRHSTVKLVKGFFADSLDGHKPSDYGIGAARIIFIDCDLKSAAASALGFCAGLIQEGTILVMDDYFSYRGNSELGVAGAFAHFQIEHPQLVWRQLFSYGYLGQAFICSSISGKKSEGLI